MFKLLQEWLQFPQIWCKSCKVEQELHSDWTNFFLIEMHRLSYQNWTVVAAQCCCWRQSSSSKPEWTWVRIQSSANCFIRLLLTAVTNVLRKMCLDNPNINILANLLLSYALARCLIFNKRKRISLWHLGKYKNLGLLPLQKLTKRLEALKSSFYCISGIIRRQ